ncbi:hypothetical protein FGM00_13645 [Aggregatimonas sangjinii]|uniref:Signal transduction histidine kinase internal region domain-containing protein n=1 Tax=Aggregatimonas sangjinii TaxID=2583587 RepID=A0A5B7SRB6_9FLAO|nr:histidine kinase [Aggregatimonas sangjinii]QCX01107.1 hypothetical protein FGM00_13645 [Aggregatimonas sangjinii]
MLKFLKKNLFWIIQFVGWGALGLIPVFSGGPNQHPLLAISIFLATLLSGLITTSVLRWFLKRFVGMPEIRFRKIAMIFGAIMVSAVLWLLLLYIFGFISGYILQSLGLPEEPPSSKKLLAKLILFAVGFVMICVWTGLYFGIKIIRKYNAERIERLKLREEVKKAQLNTLKGHINVQFMIATLKKLKKLMLIEIPESRTLLTQLSELLRYSLTKNSVDRVALTDEIEMVENYVRLSFFDHPEKLKATYQLPEGSQLSSLDVPPMLIVTLTELFIKQIALSGSSSKISFQIIVDDADLKVFLTSNIKTVTSTKSDFLKQKLEQRLYLLFGNSAELTEKHSENGSSIRLTFPIGLAKSNL